MSLVLVGLGFSNKRVEKLKQTFIAAFQEKTQILLVISNQCLDLRGCSN